MSTQSTVDGWNCLRGAADPAASNAAFMMQKLHETAETVHSDMRLTFALALYSGCDDTPLCVLSTEHRPPKEKQPPNQLITSEKSVQKCRCVLTVWHLFTVGRGTGRKKINLRQSPVMKRERGGSETEQGRVQGTGSAGPRQGPRVPSVVPCLHTEKFRTISQLPFQRPLKRDRFLPGYSPSVL